MNKKEITTYLYKTERYSEEKNPPPQDAHSFIEWLQALINSVPLEFRHNVQILFDDDGDYDSPNPELSVWWTRHETDEEFVKRVKEETRYAEARERERAAQERRLYEQLKAKFSND